MWEVSPNQRIWTAVSRVRRTPSFTDRNVRTNFTVIQGADLPIVFGFRADPAYRSEGFVQVEAGYRILLGPTASLDVAAFGGSYEGLAAVQPIAPTLELTPAPAHIFAGSTLLNLLDVRTRGAEVNAHWAPVQPWQLEASYSFLDLSSHADPAKLIAPIAANDGNAPRHQWQLRSAIAVRPGLQANASVSRVARLRVLEVPAYTRVDAGFEYRLNKYLTAAVAGQNLLSDQHREFASPTVFLASSMPRRARIDLRWQF
jgi:iron complex outermembrane receptor protein